MQLEDWRLPALRDDEILVRVKAASINPVDWKIRQGAMKFMTGKQFPRGMGQDFSGVVEGIGSRVTRFKIGDEVFGSTPVKTSGSFAETVITQEKLAAKKPAALSHEDAATLPIAGSTAWIALARKAKLKSGQKVFINGAYGAVGQAATQIAKMLGASVTGRVGAGSFKEAKALGMDMVLDYKQGIPKDLAARFDVVFDAHGGLTIGEEGMLAKRGGVILDINPSPSKMLRLAFSPSRKFVMGKQDAVTLAEVGELASKGKLKIAIEHKVRLDEGISLIKNLEAGRARGRSLIVNVA
jgi:NADPH:quinone reductase-like Zn-dependent oxidoreductase